MFEASHGMILISYTILSVVLMGEMLLLGWEEWVLPLLFFGVVGGWALHITHTLSEQVRIWIYSILMMVTFFYYGCHETSFFDCAVVMVGVIMLYTMTGNVHLITLCQFTYFITMGYDLIYLIRTGYHFDSLIITRILLHIGLVLMSGWIARVVVRKWDEVLYKSDDKIHELSEATKRMNDFLANVSHEIRTPINAVIGLTTVSSKTEKDPAIRKNLDSIKEAGERVTEQIGDILDYTEIDMGKLMVNRESYMLSSIVNDLAERTHMLGREDVEIIFDVDAKIPAVLRGDGGKIKKIIWHLLTNSVKFTKKGGVYVKIYTLERPYGVNLCIEIEDTGIGMEESEIDKIFEKFYQSDSGRSRRVGGLGLGIPIVYGFVKSMGGFMTIDSEVGRGTRVSVSIPQEVENSVSCMVVSEREKICIATFLQYSTFEVSKVQQYYNEMIANLVRGLGVLLYPAQTLEELQNLDSHYHLTHLFVGAREFEDNRAYMDELLRRMEVVVVADDSFTVPKDSPIKYMRKPFYCFPVASVLNEIGRGRSKDSEKIYTPGIKALVVDDEPMNLLVANGIFSGYGMLVSTADSGITALNMCEQEDYDIIFMDHMMPEMDGIEAMKKLRTNAARKGKELCIVALTANAVSSAKNMFISEGFDGFVPKPIEIAELDRVLKKVLPKSAITTSLPETEEQAQENTMKEETASESKHVLTEEYGDSRLSELAEAGVDVTLGLHYCQNDTEFYKTLLMQFGSDSREKKTKLNDYFEKKTWPDYAIVVHALKSTAKMIGAMDLSENAKSMEAAAKEGNEAELTASHEPLMQQYTTLCDKIDSLYGINEEEDDSEVLEFWEGGQES
ncbi:MAG: response regulator [Lachnospiraceae bacterium]|nr:response regulator [Lachnospiraceae bacterium]